MISYQFNFVASTSWRTSKHTRLPTAANYYKSKGREVVGKPEQRQLDQIYFRMGPIGPILV
jgi:hypothetical protein